MPIHWGGVLVHAMPGTELSRVRTKLDPVVRQNFGRDQKLTLP
jgi:hypothetical protein